MADENKTAWFLSRNTPEDYKEVVGEVIETVDPNGILQWCADGTTRPARVFQVILHRGDEDALSQRFWPFPPPLDVAIDNLGDSEFERLMGRPRDARDANLGDPGTPVDNSDLDIIGS